MIQLNAVAKEVCGELVKVPKVFIISRNARVVGENARVANCKSICCGGAC